MVYRKEHWAGSWRKGFGNSSAQSLMSHVVAAVFSSVTRKLCKMISRSRILDIVGFLSIQ